MVLRTVRTVFWGNTRKSTLSYVAVDWKRIARTKDSCPRYMHWGLRMKWWIENASITSGYWTEMCLLGEMYYQNILSEFGKNRNWESRAVRAWTEPGGMFQSRIHNRERSVPGAVQMFSPGVLREDRRPEADFIWRRGCLCRDCGTGNRLGCPILPRIPCISS